MFRMPVPRLFYTDQAAKTSPDSFLSLKGIESQGTVNIFEGLCISADGLNNLFHAVFGENTHILLLLKHLYSTF
jgi:hypothetical protein